MQISVVGCRAGQATSVRGQASLVGSGGDVVIDAGSGVAAAGRIVIGAASSATEIGAIGGTVAVPGSLSVSDQRTFQSLHHCVVLLVGLDLTVLLCSAADMIIQSL